MIEEHQCKQGTVKITHQSGVFEDGFEWSMVLYDDYGMDLATVRTQIAPNFCS